VSEDGGEEWKIACAIDHHAHMASSQIDSTGFEPKALVSFQNSQMQ